MLNDKIKGIGALKKIITGLKKKGKIIVFTNGCFDLLHYGHVKYLQEAKNKGNILIVAINSDASVKKIKGRHRPIINENDRMRVIAALESVDYVCLFRDETPLRIIRKLEPDILIKGSDWGRGDIVGGDFVIGCGGKVSRIKLVKRRSTTNLLKKIAKIP